MTSTSQVPPRWVAILNSVPPNAISSSGWATTQRTRGPSAEPAGATRVMSIDEGLFAQAGVDHGLVPKAEHRIPFAQFVGVFERLPDFGDDGLVIRAARHFKPEANVYDHAPMASSTLGDAIKRSARFAPLVIDGLRFQMKAAEGRMLVCFVWEAEPDTVPCLMEYLLALGVVGARSWIGKDGKDMRVRVHFRHRQPECIDDHRAFFGASVRYHQAEDAIVFKPESMGMATRKPDPQLSALLDERLSVAMARGEAKAHSTAARVREIISVELAGGDPSAAHVAAELGVNERTLRRRLSQEQTSHKQLLDELRPVPASTTWRRSSALPRVPRCTGPSSAGRA